MADAGAVAPSEAEREAERRRLHATAAAERAARHAAEQVLADEREKQEASRRAAEEISLGTVGLSLLCHKEGYPSVLHVSVEGPCWQAGRVFVGDVLERASGVDLWDASPSTIQQAFDYCRPGKSILLKLVTREGEAKSVSVVTKRLDGGDVLRRRQYGTGTAVNHWHTQLPEEVSEGKDPRKQAFLVVEKERQREIERERLRAALRQRKSDAHEAGEAANEVVATEENAREGEDEAASEDERAGGGRGRPGAVSEEDAERANIYEKLERYALASSQGSQTPAPVADASANVLKVSHHAAHSKSLSPKSGGGKEHREPLPLIARLQGLANAVRQRPLVFGMRVWQQRIDERYHYRDLCSRILTGIKHRTILVVLSAWHEETVFKTERRASLKRIAGAIRTRRAQIECLEALSAWLLEAAASTPWGVILASARRSAEDLEFVASTLGLRAAAAAAAAAVAEAAAAAEAAAKAKVLSVLLVSGKDLVAKDYNGSSDPYVTLQIGREARAKHEVCTSKVVNRSLAPSFNQLFRLHVSADDIEHEELVVRVWDQDRMGFDSLIGLFAVPLSSISGSDGLASADAPAPDAAWFTLYEMAADSADPQAAAAAGRVAGQLKAALEIAIVGQEHVAAVEALGVEVVGARNLKAMDRNGSSDPYLTLQLGENTLTRVKTKVVSKNLNPLWKRRFELLLPSHEDALVLHVQVWDHDVFGADDLIGQMTLPVAALRGHGEASSAAGEFKASTAPSWHTITDRAGATTGEVMLGFRVGEPEPPAPPVALGVHVLRAENLKAMDSNGFSDAYLTLKVGADSTDKRKKFRTKVRCLLASSSSHSSSPCCCCCSSSSSSSSSFSCPA